MAQGPPEARCLARRVRRAPLDARDGAARVSGAEVAALLGLAIYHVVSVRPALARPNLEVSRDGTPVAPAAVGLAVPVDPGPHVIEAKAPGATPFSKRVDVAAPSIPVVDVPNLSTTSYTPTTPLPVGHELPAQQRRHLPVVLVGRRDKILVRLWSSSRFRGGAKRDRDRPGRVDAGGHRSGLPCWT